MNYVFFFPDEMRAESVGCYGNAVVKTPSYDALASSGVRFDQCHVQNPVCSPSRCSLLTGLYPHNAGHRTLWHLLRKHEKSLFGYLKDAGYQILWYGKNDAYAEECVAELADDLSCSQGGHAGDDIHSFGESGYYDFLRTACPNSLDETSDGQNTARAISFMKNWKEGDKPYFIFLPLSMPHPVYSAPEPYHSMYLDGPLPALRPYVRDGKPSYYPLIRSYRGLDGVDAKELESVQAVYLGMISAMDTLLGRIVSSLKETGRSEDTMLFVSSDHGDYAGDYGLVEKWPNGFEDVLTRVPFIVSGPGCKPGHVVKNPIALFDILPTVMESAGIPLSHTQFASSLMGELAGGEGDKDRVIYAEGGYNPNEPQCFEGYAARMAQNKDKDVPSFIYYPKFLQQQEHPESVCRTVMMRTLKRKLIYRSADIIEFYDLEKDPLELKNEVANPRYQAEISSMKSQLLDWYIATSDTVPMDDDNRGFAKGVKA